MTRLRPCPHCGSSRFARIARASIEITSNAKIAAGNTMTPEVALLICRGCGRTDWFMRDHEAFLDSVNCDELTAT